jgi:hypothetical protein
MTSKKAIKKSAHRHIKYLIKSVNLIYENCAICGGSPTVAHHENYDLWNSIIFLCVKCHNDIHENDRKRNWKPPIKIIESTLKYTLERTKKDIENISKLKEYLKNNNGNSKKYNVDSDIYRDLPILYLDAKKELQQNQEKLNITQIELRDLKDSFCGIIKICEKGGS